MAMFWGIVLTIVVLVLSLITISKGYGFKHSIDEIDPIKDNEDNKTQEKQEEIS